MRLKTVWSLALQAVHAWIDDYAPSMGAALSYYTLFSIAPLLLIVTALAGMVFGDAAARGEIFGQLRDLMGDQGAAAVERLLQSAHRPQGGLIATATGVTMLLAGATSVFGELQNALDRIWRAPARQKASGWWYLVHARLMSFGMILGIAFLLMVSLVVSALLSALGKLWGPAFAGWETLAHGIDILTSFGIVTLLFAMIYKIIPRVRVAWRDVWIGAAVTSALFAVGKFAIGLYLGKSSVASAFGAAGSLAVMMLWVYYSAQIFLLGAEFTWVYAHTYGSRRGKPQPAPVIRRSEAAPAAAGTIEKLKRRPVLAFGVAAALGVAAGLAKNLLKR
ncbi:MAG: YihY/virulence factor BrkB family protein [Betaproteobacteria bacterium]|nr:MAG: YihY/virulence factor BrkB family protein [Betaproteobacteria bacterium]